MRTDRRKATPYICATLALACVFLLVSAGGAFAQQNPSPKKGPAFALIFGTVWDASNRPVAGVKVKIRQADKKKAKYELMSDRRGEFAQRVPVGPADYVVWAEVKGQKGPVAETKVRIEGDERVDIGLHLK